MKKTLCWILALLLTGMLALLGTTGMFGLAVAPVMKDGGTPAPPALQEAEMGLIRERVETLSEIYGFSSGDVMEVLTPEILEDLNVQSAAWWNTLLTQGTTGPEPSWDTTALQEVLAEDETLSGGEDDSAEMKAFDTANVISRAVVRTVLPMRQNLMTLAITKIGRKADLPDLLRFATGLPLAAAAFCLLLSGIIALMQSRRLTESLKYVGSAMGGGAIVSCAALALLLAAPVSDIIGEASPSLKLQYDALVSLTAARLGIFTAVLFAGCAVCLFCWARSARCRYPGLK